MSRIRRLAILLPTLVLLAAPAARAQILSVYVTGSTTHLTNVVIDTANIGNPQTTSFWAPGVAGGVTFGVLPIGPIYLGFDVRGSTKPGTPGADTALGGFKLTLKPPVIRIKPYIQASGGYVGTRTTGIESGHSVSSFTLNNHYAAYEIFGGVDYPILRILDIRLIEVGGGKGYIVNGLGGFQPANQISLFTLDSGLVFHF